MRTDILRRVIFTFLVTCVALSIENTASTERNKSIDKRFISSGYKYNRVMTTSKPGFFRTLFSAMFEQWVDTKNTTNFIVRAIDNNFLPENAPVTPSTTVAPNGTTPPYKIKRSEFLQIIRRNVKGINRLYNLEFADARKESAKTYSTFKRNLTSEISKFL